MAAAANKVVFTTSPTGNQTVSSNASVGPFVAQVQDQFGNPVTNRARSRPWGSRARLRAGTAFFTTTQNGSTATSVTIANGASSSPSFYYSDQAAGSPTITASGTVNGSAITGNTSTFTMVPGAESKLAITTQPAASVTAGSAFTVGVSVEDQFGNVITTGTGNNDAMSVALSSGSFAGGSTTTATASAGVASFNNLKINGAATNYTVTVSDTTHTAVTSTVTNSFNVVAAAANKVVFTTSPSGNQTVSSNASVGPFVAQVQDQFGNPVTNAGSSATLGLSSTSSSGHPFFTTTQNGSTATSVTIANGASSSPSFYYSDQAAGSPTITASGTVNGSAITGNTSTFTMVPGAESKLAITTQPAASVTAGSAFTVGVSVEDQFGNVITTGTGNNDAMSWRCLRAASPAARPPPRRPAPGWPASTTSRSTERHQLHGHRL